MLVVHWIRPAGESANFTALNPGSSVYRCELEYARGQPFPARGIPPGEYSLTRQSRVLRRPLATAWCGACPREIRELRGEPTAFLPPLVQLVVLDDPKNSD